MSRKNSREAKAQRRLQKSIRIGLPAYIDLIEYVKDRTHCTSGTAEKLLLRGTLMVDSHPVGFKWKKINGKNQRVLDRYLPAEHRTKIRVVKDAPDI